jgi:hypothetical protein
LFREIHPERNRVNKEAAGGKQSATIFSSRMPHGYSGFGDGCVIALTKWGSFGL